MTIENAIKEFTNAFMEFGNTQYQLGELRATLLTNFGPTSRSKELYGFQIETEGIHNKHSTLSILVAILESLIKRGDEARKEAAMLQFAIDERNKADEEGPVL